MSVLPMEWRRAKELGRAEHARVLRLLLRDGAAPHAAVVEAADLDAHRVVVGRSLLVDGFHGARQALHLRGPRLVRPREPYDPIGTILCVRMKTVGNGRKRNYNVENECGRYGIFLYFSN